jgi:DNA-binding NarL/FixJ family response regulator
VLIEGESDMIPVGKLASADLLLESLADKRPDVVVMDLTMPGRDPLEAMTEASVRFPNSRFIVLSGYDNEAPVNDAIDCGAWGFVSKHDDVQKILEAVRAVARGEVYLKATGR